MTSPLITRLLLILTLGTALIACEEVDDQSRAQGDAWKAANPAPIAGRDFKANNARHRILLAVVDSGTDYNHPLLIDHMHFRLDEHGQPIGGGYDFVGNDTWPSPYIARTADQNPDVPAEQARNAREGRQLLELAVRNIPALGGFLNPSRRYDQEQGGIDHGTHVAGLMVYDQPELGLMAYRVLPFNQVYSKGERVMPDLPGVYGLIRTAVLRAIADGARVVNLSLAMQHKDGDSKKPANVEKTAHFRRFIADLEKLAAENPQVVLVAAAGNESDVIDNVNKFQVPCGVRAQNILCVGALGRDSKLADFTNLIDTGAPFIFAPGTDIWSASPTELCRSPILSSLSEPRPTGFAARLRRFQNIDFDTIETWQRVLAQCQAGQSSLVKKSGTSMASPIVARLMGQILLEEPGLSGAEAVQRLFEKSSEFTQKGRRMQRLRVPKPSWYPQGDELVEKSRDGGPSVRSSSFDLYIP